MSNRSSDLVFLLGDMCSQSEMRELVLSLADGKRLSRKLPETAPVDEFAFAVVGILERHGFVSDFVAILWERYRGRREDLSAFVSRWPGVALIDLAPAGGPADIFLAHAGPDTSVAEALADLLTPRCTCFVDVRSIALGESWDAAIRRAADLARMTVVLVSRHTDAAFYQRAEIARAIQRHRATQHPVVPVWIEGDPSTLRPYGMEILQGIVVSQVGGLHVVADRLQGALSPRSATD